MTALAFVIQPEQVCIAMDTLVVGHADKRPLGFQRKFCVHGSQGVVVAGTGLGTMINMWFKVITSLPASIDFDILEERATALLQRLAPEVPGHEVSSTSLFHFGLSKSRSKYAGFVCRPPNWIAEPLLENWVRLKPEIPIASFEPFVFPAALVAILKEQQRIDELLPVQDRQGIGGEIEFAYLHDGQVEVHRVDEFSSFSKEQEYLRRVG